MMSKPFQVWQDVYAVGGPDITDPSDCCVYLIDAGELVLIDSGVGGSFDQLVDNIDILGFNPRQLKAIIVTHAHIDHIGALADFQQNYGVRLIAHELDVPAIETGTGTGAELYGAAYQPCHDSPCLLSRHYYARILLLPLLWSCKMGEYRRATDLYHN